MPLPKSQLAAGGVRLDRRKRGAISPGLDSLRSRTAAAAAAPEISYQAALGVRQATPVASRRLIQLTLAVPVDELMTIGGLSNYAVVGAPTSARVSTHRRAYTQGIDVRNPSVNG